MADAELSDFLVNSALWMVDNGFVNERKCHVILADIGPS